MSNQTNHTLNLEENSKFRIAYELMQDIVRSEGSPKQDESREHYLRLYRQCIDTVGRHRDINEVVSGVKPGTTTRQPNFHTVSW